MKYKDYYKSLGVDRDASEADIKQAYRQLARKYHPDVSKESGAEEKFKEVAEAYEVLKDEEKRAAYDQLGSYQQGQEFRPPPDWGRQYGGGGFRTETFTEGDLGDLFSELFGMGQSRGFAGSARGFGTRRGFRTGGGFAVPGEDFSTEVEVSLEEASSGTERSFSLQTPAGTRNVRVRIPQGATDGRQLRVRGKGGPGINGGRNGDLLLTIRIRPHDRFRVSGHDLFVDVPVAPWEAVLGATIEVPTMDGRVRLKIPSGSDSGKKLRVKGKGMPKPKGGAGDLYAVVQIVTPKDLNDDQRKLFEQLSEESDFDPRSGF